MKTVIMELDVPNKNGRIYKTEEMQKAVEAYNDKVCYGMLGSGLEADLEFVSHMFEDLEILKTPEGKSFLRGELTVMETPYGKILQKMVADNVEVAFRPAGIGELRQSDNGLEVVNYTMKTINALPAPQAA